MMSRKSSLILSVVAGLIGPLAIGCSDTSRSRGSGGSQGQGGSTSQGGSTAAGGKGGSNTGAGGVGAGGTGAGGSAAGGTSAGGSRTGGTSAGGTGAGGSRTGGTGAGGTSTTGGTGAGGARTGGTGAGGTSNAGGTGAGGTAAGGTSGGAGGTATGGAGGTGAGGSTAVGECTNAGTVSNFDDGTAAIRDVGKSGLTGALWAPYSDGTGSIKLAVEDGGSGTCGPKALHISGSGFSDWGGGAEFILGGTYAAPPGKSAAKPVDMSAYVGIQFKAKIGSGHKNPVRIQISIPATEDKVESSGACDPAIEGDDGCYNHMGKFFWTDADNPGLSMPMSSTWKTYTFCFDRDLFPKWLPSNLSAEQRRNLAKSFLKFQVDFNKSLDVANNAIDTKEAKLHNIGDAFDLWLDDVEFITDAGLCTNYPVGSTWKPISKAGGSCALAPEAAKFHGYIEALYTHWKAKFLSGGRVMMPEQPADGTTSESQGYGMLLSVAMDDKATFTAVWNETKTKLSNGVINWTWQGGGSGSATDGDEDVAYALYLADKKGWGTKADADALASAIKANDVSGSRLKLGSNFEGSFNPSYFAPLFYRKFSGDWGGVIDTGYGTVSKCQQSNGLIADWCSHDGAPMSANEAGAQVGDAAMRGDKVFAYEAARAGLRLGQDACWGTGGQASPILSKLLTFFADKYNGGDSIGEMMAGWLLAQGAPHSAAVANQASFIGPLGVAAKSSTSHAKMLDNAFRSTLDILETPQFNRVYYSTSLGLMTLLEMSGNMPH